MNKTRQRLIPEQELPALQAWQLPMVDGPLARAGSAAGQAQPPTAGYLEAIHRQAYEEGYVLGREEGYQKGLEEGRKAGRENLDSQAGRLHGLIEVLAEPLECLDEAVERSLVDLAVLIARHLVRRELKASPGEVVAVVRAAAAHLPVASRHPRIHLNPDDVDLVRQALALGEEERSWRIESDPRISRGGCLVEADTSYVDATVEARLSAIVARMLGGEREEDRDG